MGNSITNALTLSNYPSAVVHLECQKCQFRKGCHLYRLIAEHGATECVSVVLAKLAEGCPCRENLQHPCGMRFVEVPAVLPASA